MCLWLGEGEVAFECRARLALGLSNHRSPLDLPPHPFPQRFSDVNRWRQGFFGWAIFGKSHEVLRDAFLVVVLHMLTATRFFFKKSFLWASVCL